MLQIYNIIHEFEQKPAVRIATCSADAGHDHSQRYVVYDLFPINRSMAFFTVN